MITLASFVLLCTASVVYLLWFLSASDKSTAARLITHYAPDGRSVKVDAKPVT
jgi:hypothetical protein